MKSADKRIKIFQNWDIPDTLIPLTATRAQAPKSSQANRAEDLLRQVLLLDCNISEFKQKKQLYNSEYEESKKEFSAQSSAMFKLCNEEAGQQKADLIEKSFEEHLRKAYLSLRKSKYLEYELKNHFQNVNLQNYDKKTVKIQFTKTDASAFQELNERLNTIRVKSGQLQQALFTKQQKIPLSSMFGKQTDFQSCYQSLAEEISHSNLIQIHFLMLYHLRDLSALADKFAKMNAINQLEFNKYQAIYDCLLLMKNQKKELEKQQARLNQRLDMNEVGDRSKFIDYQHEFILKQSERRQVLQKNLKIYKSNQQNFVRVGAETDMYLYSIRRTQYSNQLEQFQSQFDEWKIRNEKLKFLYDRHIIFQEFRNETYIQRNGKVSQKDKNHIIFVYNEVLQYEPHDQIIKEYKETFLVTMEKYFGGKNIIIPKRYVAPLSQDKIMLNQIDFFKKLQQNLDEKKIKFIQSNQKNIIALQYESTSIRNQHPSELVNKYDIALRYMLVIAQNETLANKLTNFKNIFKSQKRFQALPLGFPEVLFNYIVDISILNSSNNQFLRLKNFIRDSILQNVRAQQASEKKIIGFEKIVAESLEGTQVKLFQLYDKYISLISQYNEELVSLKLNTFLQDIHGQITEGAQSLPGIDRQNITVEKKDLFNFRYLVELYLLAKDEQNLKNIKIKNMEEVISYIFTYLDRNFVILSPKEKFNDIVKLAFFQNYCTQVYSKTKISLNYQIAFKFIKNLCILNFLSSLYVIRAGQDQDSEKSILSLLRIQFKINNIHPYLQSQDNKSWLQPKLLDLTKELKKYPLTIAAKHNVAGFTNVLDFNGIINQLKLLKNSGNTSIQYLAKVFILIEKLNDMRKTLELKFQNYQNVLIKEHKSCHRFFHEVVTEKYPKINKIVREIEEIKKVFLNLDDNRSLKELLTSLCDKSE